VSYGIQDFATISTQDRLHQEIHPLVRASRDLSLVAAARTFV